jgi:hypothetical protein
MMTFMDPVIRDFSRLVRALVIACVLVSMFVMQAAVFTHAFEHLVASANKFSSPEMVQSAQIEQFSLSQQVSSQSDSPAGVTCQKCLEDAAHNFVLPDVIQVAHTDLSYQLVRTALPHNLPFLAPERANQRGPPLIS